MTRILRMFFWIGLLFSRAASRFEALTNFLDDQRSGIYGNFSLTVGTTHGEVFEYSSKNGKDNKTMSRDVRLLLGSGSKWCASTALLAMIHHAGADLDMPISRYLDWWTKDPNDLRSKVTMRHFLTMTSGMVTDGTDSLLNGTDAQLRHDYGLKRYAVWGACSILPWTTHTDCVKALYEVSPAIYAPGEYFMYGTLTFQFVAAAMEALLKTPISTLLEQYFLNPLGMAGPWAPAGKPLIGGGLTASAAELGTFLQVMLNKSFLPQALHEEQERVATQPAQYSTQNAIFGPYGMGVWSECINGGATFPNACRRARRFNHPGCFGYWNYISRRDGYYFNYLPSFKCDESNRWCDTGVKPNISEPEACPQLTPAFAFRTNIALYLDDEFVNDVSSNQFMV